MSQTTDTKETLDEHLVGDKADADPAYDSWKKSKINKGLEQSKQRSKMVSADEVWADLNLER